MPELAAPTGAAGGGVRVRAAANESSRSAVPRPGPWAATGVCGGAGPHFPPGAIVGHRGAGASAGGGASVVAENSIGAILAAADLGVEAVELDVWKTRDDVVVVFHGSGATYDGLLGETVVGPHRKAEEEERRYYIEEHSFSELQELGLTRLKEAWRVAVSAGACASPFLSSLEAAMSCAPSSGATCAASSSSDKEALDHVGLYGLAGQRDKLAAKAEYTRCRHPMTHRGTQENTRLQSRLDLLHRRHLGDGPGDLRYSALISDKSKAAQGGRDALAPCAFKCTHCNAPPNPREDSQPIAKQNLLCKLQGTCAATAYSSAHSSPVNAKHLADLCLTCMPRLEDVLKLLVGRRLTLNVELKGNKPDIGTDVLRMAARHPGVIKMISSFAWTPPKITALEKFIADGTLQIPPVDLLQCVKDNDQGIPIALLFYNNVPPASLLLQILDKYGATWVKARHNFWKDPLGFPEDDQKVTCICHKNLQPLDDNRECHSPACAKSSAAPSFSFSNSSSNVSSSASSTASSTAPPQFSISSPASSASVLGPCGSSGTWPDCDERYCLSASLSHSPECSHSLARRQLQLARLASFLHKHGKRLLTWWPSAGHDRQQDFDLHFRSGVDALCPNNIWLAKATRDKLQTHTREPTSVQNGDML
eukprot:GHVT01078814.1.p1 GENE.GHVT01078814.1~~GHVT01078814.1.p1  ORF type:complete len:650 (+),score=149.67 GHVT01078814.1:513-2462(+)